VVAWMLDGANHLLDADPIKQSFLRELPMRRSREALSAAIVEKLPMPIFQEVVNRCIAGNCNLKLTDFLNQALLKNQEKRDRLLQALTDQEALYNQVVDQLIVAHNSTQVVDTLFPQDQNERLRAAVGKWIESERGDCIVAFTVPLDTEDPRMKIVVERLIATIVKDHGNRDTARAVETAKKALDDLCKCVAKPVYKNWITTQETGAILKRHPEVFPKIEMALDVEDDEHKEALPVQGDRRYVWHEYLTAYSELVNTPPN
jgi:hypothetical protein